MAKQLIVLITGANRGIGLALTRAYLERGDRVVATCRHPGQAGELHKLKELHRDGLLVLRLDVNLGRSVTTAAEDLETHLPRLDVLINNAGIAPGRAHDTLDQLEFAEVRDAFETNALGPVRTARALMRLLRKSSEARVVNISTGAASLSNRPPMPAMYAYSSSKAALNMFTRLMAEELKSQSIAVVAITPGWVRTDLGGADAELDAAEVASSIVGAIDGITLEKTSMWLDRHGAVTPFAW